LPRTSSRTRLERQRARVCDALDSLARGCFYTLYEELVPAALGQGSTAISLAHQYLKTV